MRTYGVENERTAAEDNAPSHDEHDCDTGFPWRQDGYDTQDDHQYAQNQRRRGATFHCTNRQTVLCHSCSSCRLLTADGKSVEGQEHRWVVKFSREWAANLQAK